MVLAACGTRFGSGIGYSFLVEDLSSYRLRTGDKTATLPTRPNEPKEPEGNSSGEWKRYDYKRAAWIEWDQIQAGAIRAIQTKFPTMLAEDKNRKYKWLPATITPRQALDKIQSQVLTKKKARELYLGVIKEIMELKYKPSSIGPTIYFQELIDLQIQANQLDTAGIGNDMIMTQALVAFRESGHDKSLISKIEDDWDSDAMKVTDDEAKIKRFITYWTTKLAAVYSDEKGTHHAKLGERLTSLERAYKVNVNQIMDNQEELISALQANVATTKDMPSVINTAASGTTIETEIMSQIKASVDALQEVARGLQSQQIGQGAQARYTQPTPAPPKQWVPAAPQTEWKQWTYWCYTCGVNLKHDTKDCKRNRKAPGHDDKTTATYQDPQGGNTSRNHLWMKWCHPVTCKPCKSPQE